MSVKNRLRKLETATAPKCGLLPIAIVMPDDPTEQARVRAEIAQHEAAGQRVIVIQGYDDDPLDKLVDEFI